MAGPIGVLEIEAVRVHQGIENEIIFDMSNYSGYLQTLGESQSNGLGWSFDITIDDSWRLEGNHTWNNAEQANRQPRPFRPKKLIKNKRSLRTFVSAFSADCAPE